MGNNSVPKFIFRLSRFPVYRGSVLGRFYCIILSAFVGSCTECHYITLAALIVVMNIKCGITATTLFQNLLHCRECSIGKQPKMIITSYVKAAPLHPLEQRFSNFFQVGTTFISQNVLRTTLLLGLSNSLGLP